MGRVYKMSWEAGRKRWAKMFKGQRYLVTCEELGSPATAEGSYHAANLWWEGKLAELLRPQQQEQELLNHLPPDELDRLIEQGRAAEQLKQARGANDQCPQPASKDVIVSVVKEDGHTNLRGLAHLVGKASGKPVQKDRTIGHQVKCFLDREIARKKAANTFADLRNRLNKAQQCPHLLPSVAIDRIDEQTIGQFYVWLRNDSGMIGGQQYKCFYIFKRFVRFLYEEKLLADFPRNLASRQFTFDTGAKEIRTYPIGQVRDMLATLPDRLRLYCLLGLNCGMYGADIGSLRHVELKGNRIIRKRTKTRNKENVPTVNYLLWDETVEAVERWKSEDKDLVFLSTNGKPMYRVFMKEGEFSFTDLIKQQWNRPQPNKPTIPHSALRHISATFLEGHTAVLPSGERITPYAACATLFLGHAPESMKHRHYAPPSQELFDDALLWLRGQYFA